MFSVVALHFFFKNISTMEYMSIQYFNFVVLVFFICFVVYLLVILPQLVNKYKKNLLKDTVYECGFDPFQSSKIKFSVHFFMIAILFLIFDLEIMLLFPWSIIIGHLPLLSFVCGFIFCLLLVIGFVYEWLSGVLDLVSKNDDTLKDKNIKIFRLKR